MIRRVGVGVLTLAVALIGVLVLRADPATGVTIYGFFTDDNGRTLEEDIDAIAAADITRGCNPPANTRFCPTARLTRGEMAAFLVRALDLPSSSTNHFSDDNGHLFEAEINAIAAAGITKGCNPPSNTRFCPDRRLTRGEMAALLFRALHLSPSSTNWFSDDNGHLFEAEINALAAADITRGCNPPSNTRFCPNDDVTREQMAAFLRRALDIPYHTLLIPMDEGTGFSCKSTSECRVTYDVVAGRQYTVREGHFLVQPATSSDTSAFRSSGTRIEVSLNGAAHSVSALPESSQGNFRYRMWTRNITFPAGNHTLVVTWRWNGDIVRRTVATVRAD
ncbi:MAG TPA: S-layer homology domain-containing protein [Acidimicrobiia bacterium]